MKNDSGSSTVEMSIYNNSTQTDVSSLSQRRKSNTSNYQQENGTARHEKDEDSISNDTIYEKIKEDNDEQEYYDKLKFEFSPLPISTNKHFHNYLIKN